MKHDIGYSHVKQRMCALWSRECESECELIRIALLAWNRS